MANDTTSPNFGLIPSNARAYLRFLVSGQPPEQQDLSASDLSTLRDAALRKYQDTGRPEGILEYGDYSPTGKVSSVERAGLGETILESYRNPAFRLESLLGQSRYKFNPDSSVSIQDSYDFAANREQVQDALKTKGFGLLLQDAYKHNGFWGVLNLLGNMRASSGEGNQFEIKLRR